LSPHDHVTRLGGEEFLVTMSSTSEEMALARLERLIRSLTPLEIGANQPELTYSFSAGIALARGPDTVNSLLGRADAALYEAKHGGRGKVCVARAPKIDAA
jgi:diguanylate cyclase (GGDEF)-like protein